MICSYGFFAMALLKTFKGSCMMAFMMYSSFFVMNVGFRLALYLDSGAIVCRLGSIWASFEAHLDVIGLPNGAPKRLGDKNGAGKLPGQKTVNFRDPCIPI